MGKVTRYPATVVLAVLFLLPGISTATTYRVGPGEEYAKVSEVADRLRAGDVVEITGDISDIFTLTANGTSEKPIVIRGVTRVENGQIIRPRITPPSVPCGNLITCKGDWTVLEGLDISGQTEGAYGNAAIIQACADFTIRNCRIHHNYRAIHSLEESTGDTVVEFCELYANGYAERPPVAFYSTRLGAKITVQHCYFHDGTGGNFLRVCMPRAVVRYNWFENPYEHAVQVSTPEFGATPERIALGDSLLPYHCDIVGNVVVFGWGPGSPYCAFSLGGDSSEAPGTEGDFNIAHNLVLTRRGGATPQVAVVVHGNVDHVNLFNNVILEGGVRGCMVYSREMVFEGPRTEAFRTRRGGDPVISGVNNWISKTAFGVPDTLKATISGVNPKFMNFVGYEFHPQPESPLTRGGLWPLPEGKVGNLSPEYEPQRGIPADLRPVARRKVSVPSMGPYEASETPPAFADDSSELVLNVKDSGGRFAWPFDFGGWRRKALENLYAGRPTEALACAKMQFLLSPMDEPTIDAAIESVKQMIVALDGDDARALAFEQYARYGPEGKDGRRETEDNLRDPLMDVGVPVVGGITSSLEGLDVAIDARASVGSGAPWLMTEPERHWYRTEKALVALQTAQFEEALLALSGVLSEIARQPAGDLDNQKVAQRNQSIIDRVTAGLSVVARSRCNSVADVSEFVNRYLTYARFGPAGPDGEMGTSDDIEPDGVRSISRHVWSSPDEALALIKSTHPDTPLLAAVEARVEAVQDSYRRFVKQLELVVSESRFVATGGPAYAGSAPREFLGQMLAKTASAPPLPAGLDEQETAMVAAALRQVLESADAAALDAYLALSAAGLFHQ